MSCPSTSSSQAPVNYSRSQLTSPPPNCLNPYSLLNPGLTPGINPGINNLGSSYLLQNLLIGQIQERSDVMYSLGILKGHFKYVELIKIIVLQHNV